MVYVFLAEGFEITEAMAPVDMLRRAKVLVKTVGVGAKAIKSSCGVIVEADLTEDEIVLNDELDMIVLPGGMPGTLNEEKSSVVQGAIDYCAEQDKFVTAICAAPSILGHKGLLKGKTAVCYSGFEPELKGAIIGETGVVTDGKIITARGAGVAIEFGLALVEALCGRETQEEIRESILSE